MVVKIVILKFEAVNKTISVGSWKEKNWTRNLRKIHDVDFSACICPIFQKNTFCEHILSIKIEFKLKTSPIKVKPVSLSQKRKMVRLANTKKESDNFNNFTFFNPLVHLYCSTWFNWNYLFQKVHNAKSHFSTLTWQKITYLLSSFNLLFFCKSLFFVLRSCLYQWNHWLTII